MFSYTNIELWVLHTGQWSIFSSFFVKCITSISRYIFCGCRTIPVPFVEKTSFLHWIAFVPLSKISWLYIYGSVFGLFLLPFICVSFLLSTSCCPDYCSFIVILKLSGMGLSALLFFFNIFLDILDLSPSHINLESVFSFSST